VHALLMQRKEQHNGTLHEPSQDTECWRNDLHGMFLAYLLTRVAEFASIESSSGTTKEILSHSCLKNKRINIRMK
jgi:hypothetical protein